MEQYLRRFHDNDINDILNDKDIFLHASVNVNLVNLQKVNVALFNNLYKNTYHEFKQWDNSLLELQRKMIEGNMFLEPGFQIKDNVHVRFINMPPLQESHNEHQFPNSTQFGKFVQVKGNVVRMSRTCLLERQREYICSKCKQPTFLVAEYNRMYIFDPPRLCRNQISGPCNGTLLQKSTQPDPNFCVDIQEVKIEKIMTARNVPSSLIITLENDLVDSCQPGDCITACGVIERRWKSLINGKTTEVIVTMRANSIIRDDKKMHIGKDLPEQLLCARAIWQETVDELGELGARDIILKSICPSVHGLYIPKLALALALSSMGEKQSINGKNTIRGNSHLLLVGDPGLAKSKLLKAASEIAMRGVHTTGMGCSAAGLTAAAIQENGEWQLEAGALVLSDGGVCCIDEFNLMRECDKASIHESMEQQTISIAKAGMVCTLSSRCVVIAAANPKNPFKMSDQEETNNMNIGIASPLLSRFDIVLIFRDERDTAWDELVTTQIINSAQNTTQHASERIWGIEKLQSHFLIIQDIQPEMTSEANNILGAYYKACRADMNRDPARTSARLLDSLVRLSQAHAKLVFRDNVTTTDVVMAIRMIESSWGFGRIIAPYDIIRADIPIGPTDSDINEVLYKFSLTCQPPNRESQSTVHSERSTKRISTEQDANSSHKKHCVENIEPNKNIKTALKNLADFYKSTDIAGDVTNSTSNRISNSTMKKLQMFENNENKK